MLNEGWALICQIGLWGWIIAAAGLILHAFPGRDTFNCRAALRWGSCLVVLYAVWIVGMLNA